MCSIPRMKSTIHKWYTSYSSTFELVNVNSMTNFYFDSGYLSTHVVCKFTKSFPFLFRTFVLQ